MSVTNDTNNNTVAVNDTDKQQLLYKFNEFLNKIKKINFNELLNKIKNNKFNELVIEEIIVISIIISIVIIILLFIFKLKPNNN